MASIAPPILPEAPVSIPQPQPHTNGHNQELQTIIENALSNLIDVNLKHAIHAHIESSTIALRTEITNAYSYLDGLRHGLAFTNSDNSPLLLAEITKLEAHLDGLKKGFIHMVNALISNYKPASLTVEGNQQLQLYKPQETKDLSSQILEGIKKALLEVVKEVKDREIRNSYNSSSVVIAGSTHNSTKYERCRVVHGMRINNGTRGSGYRTRGGGGGGARGGGGAAGYASRNTYTPNVPNRGYEYNNNPYESNYRYEREYPPIIEEVEEDDENITNDVEEVDDDNDGDYNYEQGYEDGFDHRYQNAYENRGGGYPRNYEQERGEGYTYDYQVEAEYGDVCPSGFQDQGGYDDGNYDDGSHDDGGCDVGGYGNEDYEDGGYDEGGYDDGAYDDGGYDDGGYGGYDDGGYEGY